MKFLVDECTGMSVVAYLHQAGHDAVAVADVMPEADDEDILNYAATTGRVVVTNDKDFGAMVFRSKRVHRGVVLLRLHDERIENRVRVMEAVLAQVGERLLNHFVVATEAGIVTNRIDKYSISHLWASPQDVLQCPLSRRQKRSGLLCE